MKKVLIAIVAFDLILLNIFVVYSFYQNIFIPGLSESSSVIKLESENSLDDTGIDTLACPTNCIKMFSELKADQNYNEISPSPIPTAKPESIPPAATTKPKVQSTSYLPIPGSGNTLNNQWTDLEGTDFYLSTSDYPGLESVYFEANIKLQNGNGEAYVRIYDVTNLRGVDGSNLKTSSQTSVFVSNGPISLWSGYNHYKVQIKSLTADTAYFESGRIKIITEN